LEGVLAFSLLGYLRITQLDGFLMARSAAQVWFQACFDSGPGLSDSTCVTQSSQDLILPNPLKPNSTDGFKPVSSKY